MAFESKNLSVLAYSNGFTLWHFTTVDLATEVSAVGYFNEASDMLRVGDMVMANVDTDGTPGAGIYLINSNVDKVVDLSDITAIGSSDVN